MNGVDARRIGWWLAAAGVVAVVAILLWTGRREPSLRDEPQVEVVHEDGSTERMDIEAYVAGVVAGEMREGWPEAAYAAQALVARTFTLWYLSSTEGDRISTDFEVAQAYQPDRVTEPMREAVEATRGQVVTYEGEPIRAWFHAYAGGETASAREGLALQEEEPPYIEPVRLPANPLVPEEYQAWSLTLSLEEVRQALASRGYQVSSIQEVAVEQGPTGRITQVEITAPEGTVTLSGPEFRAALDPERMKSAKVTRFEAAGGNLVVEGTGFGHGVGLSQWDALRLAREGKEAEEIVGTFYKDVRVEQRWK